MKKVALPSSLQTLIIDDIVDFEDDPLPNSLQELVLGYFDRSMEKVTLPSGLQILDLGFDFNLSLEMVALPTGLIVLELNNASCIIRGFVKNTTILFKGHFLILMERN